MSEKDQTFKGRKTDQTRRAFLAFLSWLFGGVPRNEFVSTQVHVAADPAVVWQRIALYEEVTGRRPLLLRLVMPCPVRTEGEKRRVGELVRCVYDGGELRKRILALEPPYRMVFDVLEQRLGIESCVIAQAGSYEIDRVPGGSDVILTTQYRAFLHPRWLWRPPEKMVAKRLHLYILRAMQRGGNEAGSSPMPGES
ncbi:MAG TPA: hypothetical protein VMU92_12300 [Acidobacteriaceae bacterium]|nr:hypothetical protein [Acidobacteriaceae bacterium]